MDRLFGEAYLKPASTAYSAIKGFESTGIWPTNRHVFIDADFFPPIPTERTLVIKNRYDDVSHQSANIDIQKNIDLKPVEISLASNSVAVSCNTKNSKCLARVEVASSF